MPYRTSDASFLQTRLFLVYLISGFFLSDSRSASKPSVVLVRLSWFQMSGELEKSRVESGIEQRSGLMTIKSAKYSTTALTTS